MKKRIISDERVEKIKWENSYKINKIVTVVLTVLILLKILYLKWNLVYSLSDIILLLLIFVLQIQGYLEKAILQYDDGIFKFILKLIYQTLLVSIILAGCIICIGLKSGSLKIIVLNRVIPVVGIYIVLNLIFNLVIRKIAQKRLQKVNEQIEDED